MLLGLFPLFDSSAAHTAEGALCLASSRHSIVQAPPTGTLLTLSGVALNEDLV